jgi:membrane fusion protein, heavy metal efflux system
MKIPYVLSVLLFSTVTILSGAAEVDSAKAARLANTVVLDEIGVRNLRLKLVDVERGTFEETAFALGRIEVLPGHEAAVSSRIAGRAVQVNAKLDHLVSQGEDVVMVESRVAGDPPPQISLKAPMSGIVSEVNVVPGEPVSPDRALLRIVDLQTVYALARVPQHLGERLRSGLIARIRIPGWNEREWTARLEHIGAVADAASGTLEAAFEVENPDLQLRPGMRAEFSIVLSKRDGATTVPKAALQGDPAARFLYVADDSLPNAFLKVPVETGAMNDRSVEIVRGLFPGDRVVTDGAYSLAFAGKGSVSLKEALDAAHGHEHNADGSELSKGQKSATHAEDDGHSHGGSGGATLSALTLFSLIGNGVLLVLLVVATLRRGPTVGEPATGGADRAQ